MTQKGAKQKREEGGGLKAATETSLQDDRYLSYLQAISKLVAVGVDQRKICRNHLEKHEGR